MASRNSPSNRRNGPALDKLHSRRSQSMGKKSKAHSRGNGSLREKADAEALKVLRAIDGGINALSGDMATISKKFPELVVKLPRFAVLAPFGFFAGVSRVKTFEERLAKVVIFSRRLPGANNKAWFIFDRPGSRLRVDLRFIDWREVM